MTDRRMWMKTLFELFLIFAKIGAVTFGGGYAMLPMFERELVDNKKWVSEEEIMEYFAISQCTPGVIAVNTATFVGYKVKGILGGIFATLGVIAPSIIIISIISAFLSNFLDYEVVGYAFNGIRICVCVLIFNAVVKLSKSALVDKWAWMIFLLVFALSLFFNVSAVILIIISGILGLAIKKMRKSEDK